MNNYIITIDNQHFNVNTDNLGKVILNGSEFNVDVTRLSEYTYKLKVDDKIYHITTNKINDQNYNFLVDGHFFETTIRTTLEEKVSKILIKTTEQNGNITIKAPMPGLILSIEKNIGDKVQVGDALFLLEAMKMENEIKSHVKGVVSEILIDKEQSVEKNQSIIIIKS
ncbi:MAG: hypothetical protein CR986_05845 [Ignavibacteriae bacterium]|nr:MAG: hypothetical protein CR986_05845 [Ignavibacteriota bacterium]